MIEELFQKSKYNANNPLILKDCTLFLNLEHFDISDEVYIFKSQGSYDYSTVGKLYRTMQLKGEYNNIGYFSTQNIIILDGEKHISIIGYINKTRFIVNEIGIIKEQYNFSGESRFKFYFTDLRRI